VTWAVCILNWNGREDTLRCLEALSGVRGEFTTVVADNGSTDGSAAAIRAAYPHLELIENGANLGYSGGNNAAIRHALDHGAEWVVLLNNDAEPEPGMLEALTAAAARHPRAGVLAGKLMFEDGRVQWAGQRVALLTGYSGRPRGSGRPDGFAYRIEGRTDRAVGALMAVSRAAIDRAGLLDEDLFAYVEDVDWSLRIRAAGLDCVFVPTARAAHRVSASTGGAAGSTHTVYYGARNTIVVCERHRPLGAAGTAARRACILAAFLAHAGLVLRSREAVGAVMDGYRDALTGRLGERPEPELLRGLARPRRRS
jgi:GT2 family glycosyltransferase